MAALIILVLLVAGYATITSFELVAEDDEKLLETEKELLEARKTMKDEEFQLELVVLQFEKRTSHCKVFLCSAPFRFSRLHCHR